MGEAFFISSFSFNPRARAYAPLISTIYLLYFSAKCKHDVNMLHTFLLKMFTLSAKMSTYCTKAYNLPKLTFNLILS